MSEEVTTTTTDAQSEVVPVAPAPTEAPKPAEASQAAIDAASTPAPNPSAEVIPEAAAAEQPQEALPAITESDVITDEQVEEATKIIRENGKSSATFLIHKLGISADRVEMMLDKLTERGILGPADGIKPRKILIKVQRQNPAPAKKRVTDYERLMGWKEHLKEIGHYTDQKFIDTMGQYALAHPGFSKNSKWGACLIVMVNRLANRTLNSLQTFTPSDVEYLQKELTRFFSEKPLGDCPTVWNEDRTNLQQKEIISNFFNINAPYRELRGKPEMVMTAIREAAWPNKNEEKSNIGGTYAERFYYLTMCIISMTSAGFTDALFSGSYHTEPTEEFLNRVGGGTHRQTQSWIKDGKCALCGAEIKKDSQGNDVCSNFMCENSIAKVATHVKSFRQNRPATDGVMIDPNNAPLPPTKDRRNRNWKDKKNRDFHGEDERPFTRGPKRHGKRFRVNEGDEDFPSSDGGMEGHIVSSTPGSEKFGSLGDMFAGIEIPTAPAVADTEESAPSVEE